MMATICSKQLESQFRSCVRSDCKGEECELKLDGFPRERVILDVDCLRKPSAPDRRCDYFIVTDEGTDVFLLPIEFKATNLDFPKIKAQLEESIKFFSPNISRQFEYYPVLVSKRLRGRHERKELAAIQICHDKRKKRIKHVRCNQALKWNELRQ